jgi:hypothetical protein
LPERIQLTKRKPKTNQTNNHQPTSKSSVMKINKINKITAALIGLGLVSFAGVALADSTVTIGGQQYTEVFITGSTAFRANVFNAVNTAHSGAAQPNGSGGVFDALPTYVMPGLTGTPSGGTGAYTAYGTINGVRYCLCFSWTGSEAGLWAIQHNVNGIPNPVAANTLNGNPAYPNAVIPGTPAPTTYVDPTTGNYFTAPADLSFADTSQAVSLSPTPALHDFGIVGAVTFEWVKGYNSAPNHAYNDLVNVTDPQLNILLGGYQVADFFTGDSVNDSDTAVFAVGRNKASGTHQNFMIDTQHGTTTAVDQWVVNNATYNGSGQLTAGAVASLASAGGITEVFNDGYDSGGGVAATMNCDEAGSAIPVISGGTTLFTAPVIMLGYLGVNDALGAISGGAVALKLNGVPENDATIINGSYSCWGHEHLYGTPTVDAPVTTVGQALAGNVLIDSFSAAHTTPPNGAINSAGGLGGGEANPAATQSGGILPQYMKADKPQGSDSGYPSQI